MKTKNFLAAVLLGVARVGSSTPITVTAEPAKLDEATHLQVIQNYGNIPLSFEANEGQQDRQVKFLSRGNGYNLFLTNGEAVLELRKLNEKAKTPTENSAAFSQKAKSQLSIVRTKLVGARSSPKLTGQEELPGKINYFIGNDPTKWRTNVTTYSKVRYEQVYPGIDLVYYGNQHQLEYDFVVAPGADPTRIRLSVAGARKMYVDSQGELIVQTASGPVRWNKPAVYQEIDGNRCAVKGEYVLRRGREVSFRVAAYDPVKPLIIDPTLIYSTYLGDRAVGVGIAVDNAGNAYVTGETSSADFPTTAGAFQTTIDSFSDAFVTKLNSTGTALVYSTFLGGNGGENEEGNGITVDAAGNAYVTGITDSTDFPTTPGAFQTTYGGNIDGFVTKLNSTGNALIYSTYLGGSDGDSGVGIALDSIGNAYVTGYTSSTDFPTSVGAFQTTYGGGFNDAFVAKLNSTGTVLLYSSYLGGSSQETGRSVAVDSAGNAYVTGFTASANFPTTAGAFQTTYGGLGNAFVTKLNFTGTGLLYSTYLGSGSGGQGIAVDSAGDAYVAGQTISNGIPTTPGAFQTTFGGGNSDAFVTQLNPTGTGLLYSTYLGGSSDESGNGIGLDSAGDAYVTGSTSSANFPTTPGAFQTTFGGNNSDDAFVTKLNPTGTSLLYSTYLGGSDIDDGFAIAVDGAGSAYVTGQTLSTDFPTTAGAFQTTFSGSFDAFVAKIQPSASGSASSSKANFNGTPISQGNYIWFNSVIKPSGLGSHAVTFRFTQQTITSANFTLSVPDATVTFDPAATSATTTFSGGMWMTRVPSSGLAGNTFLSALSYLVPANLPGGIKNVTWSGTFTSDTPGVSLHWQWAAAVYHNFSGDYNSLGVKPVDDNAASQYKNSDHAGTPENFKSNVIGGATGGGGSNYTGGYSGTVNVGPFQ